MRKTIVLDANLIALLIVGYTNPAYIPTHRRLREYDLDSFALLKDLISRAKELLVTPNALAEASNLLRQIAEPARTLIGRTFARFIARTRETYVKSLDASSREEFLRLGLSDTALLEVAKDDIAILSVDLDLCIAAQIAGYQVVNFNHVREDYAQRG